MTAQGEANEAFEDYENLILVGVWLAVKQNGETLQQLIKWSELPRSPDDESKFFVDQDIHFLCDSFLEMLFQAKHRGAISITASTFEAFVKELLASTAYADLPMQMLEKALQRILSENHCTILRRSAGIPPTIVAILRAEPAVVKATRSHNKVKGVVEKKSEETLLLNKTLDFLLAQFEKADEREDNKIHAFNIMKVIFSDAYLRHDCNTYIPRAMIVSLEELSSDSWSIRNSALMNFTALIKRLLDNFHIQNQDLSKKRGFTILDLLTKFESLMTYFTGKLQECSASKTDKVEKDKQDLTIFSILLLTSRLVPFSFFAGEENLGVEKDARRDVYHQSQV